MFSKLRKQLTLTYTLLIWIIVTVIIAGSLTMNERQLEQKSKESFRTLNTQIVYRLHSNTLEVSWLSQLEAENKLIISIKDNNKSLFFHGSWNPVTNRGQLIDTVNTLALAHTIDITKYPISSDITSSSIFQFTGQNKEPYYGMATILPSQRGWKSLILVQATAENEKQILTQRFLFALIDVAGLFLLFFVNWFFIGSFLKPIEENRKKQTEFVAAASHELRSPLAVVQASTSGLKTASKEQAEKFIKGILSECTRMGRLIDDMLILANADAKNWSVIKGIVETDTLLIEAYELFLPVCYKKQQQLRLELPENTLSPITGDKQRLLQIVTVLLDNAYSYTPVKGIITIRGFQKQHAIVLEIADNGIGIANEQKKQIFDRFYRGDKSRNDKSHFGLGLSIAMELIHLHNGKLYCKDTPGGGATFVIELKISEHS